MDYEGLQEDDRSQYEELYDDEGNETNVDDSHLNLNVNDRNINKSCGQEAVETLLSAFGEKVEECCSEFAKQEIHYKDLAALSAQDLKLLGIQDHVKQNEMIETFHELPNQEMSYETVGQCSEASKYNEEILGKSASYVQSMNSSLSSANLKLKMNPSNDIVVEDKSFASRFVVEALDELKKVTDDMEDRLRTLEQVAYKAAKLKEMNKPQKSVYGAAIMVVGVCTGISLAYWLWNHK